MAIDQAKAVKQPFQYFSISVYIYKFLQELQIPTWLKQIIISVYEIMDEGHVDFPMDQSINFEFILNLLINFLASFLLHFVYCLKQGGKSSQGDESECLYNMYYIVFTMYTTILKYNQNHFQNEVLFPLKLTLLYKWYSNTNS